MEKDSWNMPTVSFLFSFSQFWVTEFLWHNFKISSWGLSFYLKGFVLYILLRWAYLYSDGKMNLYHKCNFLISTSGEASYKMRYKRSHCKEKYTTKQSIMKWGKGMWKTHTRSKKKCPMFHPKSGACMNERMKIYREYLWYFPSSRFLECLTDHLLTWAGSSAIMPWIYG